MMNKFFADKVKEQLVNKVKGDISVHIVYDILIVEIYRGAIMWRYTVSNISHEIITGLSSYDEAKHIIKEYKKYILALYLN